MMPNVMQITHSELLPGFAENRRRGVCGAGDSDLMMFGWNLCSALGLKFICKHNIFFFMPLQLNQTHKGIPLRPADACSNYIRNSISKWAVCIAWRAHHHPDNLPPLPFFFFLFFFEGAEAAERAVSDSFRELLAQFNITSFRAASLGLGFVRHNRKLCYQNQFCAVFFSHTHQINNRTQKRMARCFLAR